MKKSDIIKICVLLVFCGTASLTILSGSEHRDAINKATTAQEDLLKAGEGGIKSAASNIKDSFTADPSVTGGLNYYVVRSLFSKKKYKDAIKLSEKVVRSGGISKKVEQSLGVISIYSQYMIDAKKGDLKATSKVLKSLDALLRRDRDNPDCLVMKGVFLLNEYERTQEMSILLDAQKTLQKALKCSNPPSVEAISPLYSGLFETALKLRNHEEVEETRKVLSWLRPKWKTPETAALASQTQILSDTDVPAKERAQVIKTILGKYAESGTEPNYDMLCSLGVGQLLVKNPLAAKSLLLKAIDLKRDINDANALDGRDRPEAYFILTEVLRQEALERWEKIKDPSKFVKKKKASKKKSKKKQMKYSDNPWLRINIGAKKVRLDADGEIIVKKKKRRNKKDDGTDYTKNKVWIDGMRAYTESVEEMSLRLDSAFMNDREGKYDKYSRALNIIQANLRIKIPTPKYQVQALTLMKRAHEEKPNATLALNIGILQYKRKRHRAAVASFLEYIELAGSSADSAFVKNLELLIAPPITIPLTPKNGELTRDKRPMISCRFASTSPLAEVTTDDVFLLIDDDPVDPIITNGSELFYIPQVDISHGEHEIKIELSHGVNEPIVTSWLFNVDSEAPVPTLISPPKNKILTGNAKLKFVVGLEDEYNDIEISSVNVEFTGTHDMGNLRETFVKDGQYAFRASDPTKAFTYAKGDYVTPEKIQLITKLSVRPGNYKMKISFSDVQNNKGTKTWSFEVE